MTDEDIAAFEQTHNLKVMKTSAKFGTGVDKKRPCAVSARMFPRTPCISMLPQEAAEESGKFFIKNAHRVLKIFCSFDAFQH